MTPPPVPSRSRALLLPLAVLAGLLLVLLLGLGYAGRRVLALLDPPGRATVTHDVVIGRVKDVARLVTSETGVRDVVIYRHRRLGSTKQALVVVSGRVLAGIELGGAARVDVIEEGKRIAIALPRARVMGVEITELRTYDERSGLWNPYRPVDSETILQLARRQLEASARQLDLTGRAEESARQLLASLFRADGYEVDVTFDGQRDPGPAGVPRPPED
ncbi:MAG: DUF4230 domain-containing protein [Gemmatimonadales bacterium]